MRIGVLLSRTGPSAIWRLGAEACAELASAELNAEGGVMGGAVELVHLDGGASPAEAEMAAAAAADHVDVMVGLQPSHQRNAVRRALGGRAPYIYTPQHEGGWCGPAVAAIGPTDQEVLEPGIRWLAERGGARRFFFVGNDYVWPRVCVGHASAAVRAAGGRMVGAQLLPFGVEDHGPVLDAIRAARPDAVISVLLGQEAVRFHRAFGDGGLAPIVPRLTLACDETMLWAVGPEHSENLFAAQGFFMGGPAGAREKVLDRYGAAFSGKRPPVTAMSLGVYDGVRLAAAMAAAMGETDGRLLAARMTGGFPRADALRLIGAPQRNSGRVPLFLAEADGAEFRPCLAL